MILFIDTSNFDALEFVIVDGPTVKLFQTKLAFNENYKTVEFLEKFLKREKIRINDFKKIIVCTGPGSFTGIRVGVSLAQALGFALCVPVIAIPKSKVPQDIRKLPKVKGGKTLTLNYGAKPNITKTKRKKKNAG